MRKNFTLLIFLVSFYFYTTAQSIVTATESFDGVAFLPVGWTDIGGTAPANAWSRVTAGVSPIIATHSGAGMARFNSFNITAGQERTIVTPVITYNGGCIGTYTVKFWIYRDNGYPAYGDSIGVWVNTAASLAGAVGLGSVCRSRSIAVPDVQAANGWYQYSFNIPASFNGPTNYILFKGHSEYGNNTFIDDVQWTFCANTCSGTPIGGSASASPSILCATGNSTISLSGASIQPGITYQWQSSPAGANTFLDIPGANAAAYNAIGVAASTDYRCRVTCTNGGANVNSTITTVFISGIPSNDAPCGAVALTLGGATDCGNTTCATATGDPTLICSAPNNTVWYSYTPAATGTVEIRLSRNLSFSSQLNAWVQFYTATGACPALTLTQVNAAACTGTVDLGSVANGSLTSPLLSGGTTYYIMIDGFSGSFGAYCINLVAPPPPPPCTTNIAPANATTGVLIPGGAVNISWNAAATATSYDIFFATVNPPTTSIGNTVSTNVNITALNYNTTYYWYVAPKNTGGAAIGCNTSTTSFTTENPANCISLYTTGCSSADSLSYFTLKGNSGTVIYNRSGNTCTVSPVAYSDYTAFTPVTLSRGESYSGKMRTGDPNDYATIWIDANDNGYFEDNERMLDNLKIGTADKLYSIYIPSTMPTGIHRLRVRIIYSGAKPTALTHPCNSFVYGETEDYRVDISSTGSTRFVATGTPGACENAAETTIGASSNNNVNAPVYLVDSLNKYICAIYPDGNNLGLIQGSFYVHNGPVRQDVTGRYYLDRNISIGTEIGPASPYRFRYFYLNTELNALIAQPGSGVTSQFDLNMTKTNGSSCENQYVQQTPTFQIWTGVGSISGDRFLDFVGFTSFSRFFLHGGSSVLIPVNLSTIKGEITGAVNTIYWTTATENNNRKFVVERSMDGTNFTTIGEVMSSAINGNSNSALNYTFADINPLPGKTYYRLQMLDHGGRITYSPVVSLRRGSGKMEITDLRPNPTSGVVFFNVSGANGNIHITVRDLNGKEIICKGLVQPNSFHIDLSKLSSGMYLLEAVDVRSGEKAIIKVMKE